MSAQDPKTPAPAPSSAMVPSNDRSLATWGRDGSVWQVAQNVPAGARAPVRRKVGGVDDPQERGTTDETVGDRASSGFGTDVPVVLADASSVDPTSAGAAAGAGAGASADRSSVYAFTETVVDRPMAQWGSEGHTESWFSDDSGIYSLLGGGLALGMGVAAGGAGGSGAVASAPLPIPPLSVGTPVQVIVQDGYIRDAGVYLDRNRDGQIDNSELVGRTDANGRLSVVLSPAEMVDAELIVVGGVNTDSGMPNTMTLALSSVGTLPGTVIISPLTTLVSQLVVQSSSVQGAALNWSQAEAAIKLALGIPASVSLISFDAQSGANLNSAEGLAVHKASAIIAAVSGAQALSESALFDLSAWVLKHPGQVLSLDSAAELADVFGPQVDASVYADVGAAVQAIEAARVSSDVADAQREQATPVIVGLASDTGSSAQDRITNDPRLMVQGRQALSVVEFSTDGGQTWSSNLDPADGAVTVVSRLRFEVGGQPVYSGVSQPFTFELDTRAPSQPQIALANDSGTAADFITADATLTVTGLTAGTLREYRIDAGPWQTLSGDAAALKLDFGADGSHDVYVRQTTLLTGNVAEQKLSFVLDTQAQVGTVGLAASDLSLDPEERNDTGISATDDITAFVRPVIAGQTEAGAVKVVVEIAGQTHILTVGQGLNADGSWSLELDADLEDGTYRPVVTVTDGSGNVSQPTATGQIVIDTLAPEEATVRLDPASDAGPASNDGITNVTRPTLVGTAEAGALVLVDVDGTTYTTTADADGQWTVTVSQTLDEGEYEPEITVIDRAGNISETFIGDTITIQLSSGLIDLPAGLIQDDEEFDTGIDAADGITSNPLPLIVGEAPEGTVVVMKLGGQVYSTLVDDSEEWSFQVEEDLEDGTYVPGLLYIDAAGNVVQAQGATLVIDTQAPEESTGEIIHDAINDTGLFSDDGITNNNSPVLEGVTDPFSLIVVDIDGTEFEGEADADGFWQITLDGLDDGEYTPAITVIDRAGNASDPIDGTPFVIDTEGPEAAEGGELVHDDVSDTGLDVEDNITANNQPTLFGTAEPNAEIEIDLNGLKFSTVADDNGDWLLEVDRPLPDGEYLPIVSITDVAGNISESEGVLFVIDSLAPSADTVTGGVTPEEDIDTGASSEDGITNVDAPTISGTADALAIIRVEVDGTVYETEADDDGLWSVDIDPLPDGTYTPTITVTDAAGNESEPIEGRPFTIDTEGPDGSSGQLVQDAVNDTGVFDDDGITRNNSPVLEGVADPFARILVDIDGTEFEGQADAEGFWQVTLEDLGDGEYIPLVTVFDSAGNASEPTEGTPFVIDTEGPEAAEGGELVHDDVSDTGLDVEDNITANNQPTLFGTAEPNAEIEIDLNGLKFSTVADDNGEWLLEVDRPLPDGEYVPVISVADGAGNITESEGVLFVIDTLAPSADTVTGGITSEEDIDTGASSEDGITNVDAPTISGTADALAIIRVEVDGTVYETEADDDGLWSVDIDSLSDGTYTPIITVTDAAGNESEPIEGRPFTIDTEGPSDVSGGLQHDAANDTGVFDDDGITNNARPIISGQADPGAIIVVDFDGSLIYDTVTDAQGNWSLQLPDDLPDGEYVPILVATDLAGNASDEVELETLIVDTQLEASSGGLAPDEDNDTGISNEDGITNNSSPLLTGTTEAGALVMVEISGLRYEALADDDGLWEVQIDEVLADGTYKPRITVTDLAGNTDTFDGTPFTLDTVAALPGGNIGQHVNLIVGQSIDLNVFGANDLFDGNLLEDYGGTLPDGLSIDDVTHHLVGTPTAAGLTWIAASTSDDAGNIATQYFQLVVTAREKSGVISINSVDEEAASTYLGTDGSENRNLYSAANDVILTGAGDDVIQIFREDGQNFARIDGGDGFDIVKFYGADLDIDLSDFNNPDGSGRVMENIEAIQFTSNNSNMTITAADIFNIRSDVFDPDGKHSLLRINAGPKNGGTVSLDGLFQVGAIDAFGSDGAKTDGRSSNMYTKFQGTYTDGNGDHLVELLLQKGLTAA